MKQKSLGFKFGIALAALHFCMVLLAFLAMVKSRSSTSGLVFIWFYFLDAPLLLLFPSSVLKLFGVYAPIVQFGVFGSGMWFLIPWLIDLAVTRVSPRWTRPMRVLIIAIAIPLLLAVFVRLSFLSTKLLIQQERPAELKKALNQASSDFLTGKVVFEDDAPGGVSNITRGNCRPGSGTEYLLALPRGIVFLNENYQEQARLNLSDRMGFKSIEPLFLDATHTCAFLGYMFQNGIYVFDAGGKELWRYSQTDKGAGAIDGVRFGDIDGDRSPEFVVYHRYREGISLLDAKGKTKWTHPIYALGHLELADVQGDGKAEIIFDNSNNANGVTEFTFLDSAGTMASQMKMTTASYEFAIVKWPKRDTKPNILLTEDAKIRLADLNGSTVMQLDAPGCRTFGEVKALTVKFNAGEPDYLVVRKSLHPDLSVLYVYNPDGELVYQKTEVVEGLLAPTLAVVPADEYGAERLLVGESAPDFRARVLEYALTR